VRQPSQIGAAPFFDQLVVHDGRTGRLFRLNQAAAQIWRALRDGDREDAIAAVLARCHGLDPEAVRGDLEAFVAAARRAGLLTTGAAGDAGSAELPSPRRQPALDAAYRLGEVVVRVSCYCPDIAAAFAPLAAPALVPEMASAQIRLALFRASGAFVLTRDERVVDRLDTAPTARWALVRELVSAARRRPWLALLHAGAVALPAGCLLLCGDSGAGKSTLLAGLVHAEFPFLADDVAPLEQGSGLVWPVPLAISVKRGSWPVIGGLFPELAAAPVVRFGDRTMRHLWPDHAVAACDRGYRAVAVLFPRYVEAAPVTLTRLDPMEALVLFGEGGSVLPTNDVELAEFLAWWRRLPAYRLSYGRLTDAVAVVRAGLRADALMPAPSD
jgi:Coenzyme PQQ synthesis protein D (PqqD)